MQEQESQKPEPVAGYFEIPVQSGLVKIFIAPGSTVVEGADRLEKCKLDKPPMYDPSVAAAIETLRKASLYSRADEPLTKDALAHRRREDARNRKRYPPLAYLPPYIQAVNRLVRTVGTLSKKLRIEDVDQFLGLDKNDILATPGLAEGNLGVALALQTWIRFTMDQQIPTLSDI